MSTKHATPVNPADPFEAFRDLAYGYGVADLAKLMTVKPGTLYNKADADQDSHHQPTLRDVVMATRLTGDMQVLDALEEMFGRAAFDTAQLANASDEALLELLAKLGKESGEFHAQLHKALSDRTFRTAQLNHIRAEAFDMVGALMTLVARLEGLVDD